MFTDPELWKTCPQTFARDLSSITSCAQGSARALSTVFSNGFLWGSACRITLHHPRSSACYRSIRVRRFFEIVAAVTPLLVGVGAALAYSKARGRSRKLGAVDPHAATGELEIDEAEYEIAPGSYDDEDNPSAPSRDEPGYEGGCLKLGKWHTNYGDPYRVCLTANQEQKLFKGKRTKLRKLGCGVFACAYESPVESRVVKITRDSEDVAALLKAQKLGVAAKVFAVYKLKQGGRTTPVRHPITMRMNEPRHVDAYALIVERLRMLTGFEREEVQTELFQLKDAMGDGVTHTPLNKVCERVAEMNAQNYGEEDASGCTETQEQVLGIIRKLRTIGIDWDDFHAGNMGYDKKGKLKALDLGVTRTPLETDPEVLEGRQRRAGMLLRGLVEQA